MFSVKNKNAERMVVMDSPEFLGSPKAPTPAVRDNSTNIATTEYINNNCHGVNQTWRSVARSVGSTYTNTTNKTIQVMISLKGTGTGYCYGYLTVGYLDTEFGGYTNAVDRFLGILTFNVKPGQSYKITSNSAIAIQSAKEFS